MASDPNDLAVWQYKDKKGNVQPQPYPARRILNWFDKGYFTRDTEVRDISQPDVRWCRLADVLSRLEASDKQTSSAGPQRGEHKPTHAAPHSAQLQRPVVARDGRPSAGVPSDHPHAPRVQAAPRSHTASGQHNRQKQDLGTIAALFAEVAGHAVKWFYLDDENQARGPFPSTMMGGWCTDGWFQDQLRMCAVEEVVPDEWMPHICERVCIALVELLRAVSGGDPRPEWTLAEVQALLTELRVAVPPVPSPHAPQHGPQHAPQSSMADRLTPVGRGQQQGQGQGQDRRGRGGDRQGRGRRGVDPAYLAELEASLGAGVQAPVRAFDPNSEPQAFVNEGIYGVGHHANVPGGAQPGRGAMMYDGRGRGGRGDRDNVRDGLGQAQGAFVDPSAGLGGSAYAAMQAHERASALLDAMRLQDDRGHGAQRGPPAHFMHDDRTSRRRGPGRGQRPGRHDGGGRQDGKVDVDRQVLMAQQQLDALTRGATVAQNMPTSASASPPHNMHPGAMHMMNLQGLSPSPEDMDGASRAPMQYPIQTPLVENMSDRMNPLYSPQPSPKVTPVRGEDRTSSEPEHAFEPAANSAKSGDSGQRSDVGDKPVRVSLKGAGSNGISLSIAVDKQGFGSVVQMGSDGQDASKDLASNSARSIPMLERVAHWADDRDDNDGSDEGSWHR